jgi:hypothetical protein
MITFRVSVFSAGGGLFNTKSKEGEKNVRGKEKN